MCASKREWSGTREDNLVAFLFETTSASDIFGVPKYHHWLPFLSRRPELVHLRADGHRLTCVQSWLLASMLTTSLA